MVRRKVIKNKIRSGLQCDRDCFNITIDAYSQKPYLTLLTPYHGMGKTTFIDAKISSICGLRPPKVARVGREYHK